MPLICRLSEFCEKYPIGKGFSEIPPTPLKL
jgi:hypothetical protein